MTAHVGDCGLDRPGPTTDRSGRDDAGRSRTPRRAAALATVILALAGASAGAAGPVLVPPRSGLAPEELGLVVREGDPVSEAIAEHYRAARGIPVENVVRLPVPLHGDSIPAEAFAALRQSLDTRLPARVQATLVTWLQPSRVTGGCAMSITSAFALGYDDRHCSLGDRLGGSPSPYHDHDTTRPWDDLRLRPSMVLGAATLEEARTLIARGRRADGTHPPGDAYLVRTRDAVRSLRWPDFEQAARAPGVHVERLDLSRAGPDDDALRDRTGVMFYFTGLARTPGLASNTYRPGAVGDSLTSFGGVLGGTTQTTVLEWLRAGLTGSYGTVEEPFAHAAKFPRVSVLMDHYQRGATLVEAYWKSVQQPGQGLFVGDPLARPFADAPRWRPTAGGAALTTRALRAGRRYPVLHRAPGSDAWTSVGTVTGGGPLGGPYEVPNLPTDGEVRLAEAPCPTVPRIVAAVRGDPTPLPAGQVRRLAYQVVLQREAPPPGCGADGPARVDLVVGPLRAGLAARVPDGVVLPAGVPVATRIDVMLPPTFAGTASVLLGWRAPAGGAEGTLGEWRIASAPAAAPPPLRIVAPGPGWQLPAAPGPLPVEADVAPASGIARVRFTLRPALAAFVRGPAAVAEGPGFAAVLAMPGLPPGTYRLTAQGEREDGAPVAAVSWLVQLVRDPGARRAAPASAGGPDERAPGAP